MNFAKHTGSIADSIDFKQGDSRFEFFTFQQMNSLYGF